MLSPSELRQHRRSCYRERIGRCSWISACQNLCCVLCGLGKLPNFSLCLQTRLIFALPELCSELDCLPASCWRTIFAWGADVLEDWPWLRDWPPPCPPIETFKRAAWRLHPDVWACSAWGGACRLALPFLQGDSPEDNVLNVWDSALSSVQKNPGALSVWSWHFYNLKREGLKTTNLKVKHIWALEEVGFRFPLRSSVWVWIVY